MMKAGSSFSCFLKFDFQNTENGSVIPTIDGSISLGMEFIFSLLSHELYICFKYAFIHFGLSAGLFNIFETWKMNMKGSFFELVPENVINQFCFYISY